MKIYKKNSNDLVSISQIIFFYIHFHSYNPTCIEYMNTTEIEKLADKRLTKGTLLLVIQVTLKIIRTINKNLKSRKHEKSSLQSMFNNMLNPFRGG